MLQRIGLAQALIADPELLILDEPTAGVDPIGAADIASLITGLKAEGKTVLLCSHLLSQVEAICDRVAIMSRGRLLREGTVASLTENTGKDSIRVDGLSKDGREAVETLANEQGGTVLAPSRSLEDLFLELARKTEDPL
jgi:ABC-2 type transport system ATP-binding protein